MKHKNKNPFGGQHRPQKWIKIINERLGFFFFKKKSPCTKKKMHERFC